MTTVALVVHPDRPDAGAVADDATDWLTTRGHRALRMAPDVVVPGGDEGPVAVPLDGADERLGGADVAVSLGGDGTMLRTIDLASRVGIPVLGVNLGRLGYLTEVEPAGLPQALERVVSGDYQVEERMTLEVAVQPVGAPPATYLALNEAVVEKTVPGHTVRLAASIAGRPFVTYAADGVLVATPTGSTAYNLSARGPILSPRLRAVVVTPISPHMLFDRPLVLEPDESFTLEVAGPRPGVLVVDGLPAGQLEPGDTVACRGAPTCARLITFGGRDFHAVLKARFHLADR